MKLTFLILVMSMVLLSACTNGDVTLQCVKYCDTHSQYYHSSATTTQGRAICTCSKQFIADEFLGDKETITLNTSFPMEDAGVCNG